MSNEPNEGGRRPSPGPASEPFRGGYRLYPEGTELYFTSDTHFSHASILKFCRRPFASVEEMDRVLVENWNKVVPPGGIVYHLGDFAFGSPRVWRGVLEQLNGEIHLVVGNHDRKNLRPGLMRYFAEVATQVDLKVGGQEIYLNHYPFLCYAGSYRDTWQFFGHVHTMPGGATGLDNPRLAHLFPMQYDVGVDNNGFRPVPYSELKAIMRGRIQAACAAMQEDERRRCREALDSALPAGRPAEIARQVHDALVQEGVKAALDMDRVNFILCPSMTEKPLVEVVCEREFGTPEGGTCRIGILQHTLSTLRCYLVKVL